MQGKQINSVYDVVVYTHDIQAVRDAISSKLPLNDVYDRTPLHAAAAFGDLEIVKFLVEEVDETLVNQIDKLSENPAIVLAVKNGHLAVVQYLYNYEKEADIKYGYQGTLLMIALDNGHLDIAEFLIEQGTDIHQKSKYDKSLIESLLNNDKFEAAAFLIKKDPNTIHQKDEYGHTLLAQAISYGKAARVEFLAKHGADINEVDEHGASAIERALQTEDLEMATILLAHNVNIKCKSRNGGTLLHSILNHYHTDNERMAEKLQLLIQNGVDINETNHRGLSLLSESIMHKTECVKIILDLNPDINLVDRDGNTPLDNAILFGRKEVAQLLASRGGKINKAGENLFQLIEKEDSLPLLNIILEQGVDPNITGYGQTTALHQAVLHGNLAGCKSLIAHKANLNAKDERGNTPMHILATDSNYRPREIVRKFEPILEYLCQNKADPNILNNDGLTPLHRIIINEAKDNIQKLSSILVAHGADVNQMTAIPTPIPIEVFEIEESIITCKEQEAVRLELNMRLELKLAQETEIKDSVQQPEVQQATTKISLTPLHIAVNNECADIVLVLLQNGADPTKLNSFGHTSLETLSEASNLLRKQDRALIGPYLLRYGALKDSYFADAIYGDRRKQAFAEYPVLFDLFNPIELPFDIATSIDIGGDELITALKTKFDLPINVIKNITSLMFCETTFQDRFTILQKVKQGIINPDSLPRIEHDAKPQLPWENLDAANARRQKAQIAMFKCTIKIQNICGNIFQEHNKEPINTDLILRNTSNFIAQGKLSWEELAQQLDSPEAQSDQINDTLADFGKTILLAKHLVDNHKPEEKIEIGKVYKEHEKEFLSALIKDMSFDQIIVLSKTWHNPHTIAHLNQAKDFTGHKWPALVAQQTIIIDSKEYIIEALTNPEELKIEGSRMGHCVGGYANKCTKGSTHILTISNKEAYIKRQAYYTEYGQKEGDKKFKIFLSKNGQGYNDFFSTLELNIDKSGDIKLPDQSATPTYLSCRQHYGVNNASPNVHNCKVYEAFKQKIKTGVISIDTKYLESERFKRIKQTEAAGAGEQAVLQCGYNPFTPHKYGQVRHFYKTANAFTESPVLKSFLENLSELSLTQEEIQRREAIAKCNIGSFSHKAKDERKAELDKIGANKLSQRLEIFKKATKREVAENKYAKDNFIIQLTFSTEAEAATQQKLLIGNNGGIKGLKQKDTVVSFNAPTDIKEQVEAPNEEWKQTANSALGH